ncbi:MAG: OmpA family protein [Bacteroidota bacterium]
MNQLSKISCLIGLSVLLIFTSCKWSNRAKGTTIGAGSGAAIGGAIGKKAGNTTVGILIGAAVGGTAGYFIGRYMDKQAEEIRQDLAGAEVERVGEGILITFNSSLLFPVDSYQLNSASKQDVRELATILNKYDDTEIVVQGHTDNTGSDEYNLTLSRNRAFAVKDILRQQQVENVRLNIEGYGEEMPTASNETQSGRQQNRRVEIAIYANKKLKKAAKKGQLEEYAGTK